MAINTCCPFRKSPAMRTCRWPISSSSDQNMKVSTRVHYGLRAMTELARSYGDQHLLSLSEIARNEDLPLAYLEQLRSKHESIAPRPRRPWSHDRARSIVWRSTLAVPFGNRPQ